MGGRGLFPLQLITILQRPQPESQGEMDVFFQLQLSFTEKPEMGDDPVRRNRTKIARDGSSNRIEAAWGSSSIRTETPWCSLSDRINNARVGRPNGRDNAHYRAHSRRKPAPDRPLRGKARREYFPSREAGKKNGRPRQTQPCRDSFSSGRQKILPPDSPCQKG